MTIFRKIGLSKRYGKAIYAISAVLTLAISSLVFFNPYAIPMCVLLKLVSIPIILYLYTAYILNSTSCRSFRVPSSPLRPAG